MDTKSSAGFDRRTFLTAGVAVGVVGGGLVLGIRYANRREEAAGAAASGRTLAPNAFVRVAPDDTITVVIGKAEMGQGIYTGLAMALAEELDVDPARVKVELAGADPAFNVPFMPIQITGGSMSTSTTYTQLREAGARARAMLLAAAAQKWNVDAATLRTENGKVLNGSKSSSYGALADAASQLPVPEKVTLKDPAQFRYLGKPIKRLDAPMKVDGSAKFGLDMRVPGMLFAVIARPPVIGATLGKVDDSAARAVQGVVDVKVIPAGVAVYGTNTWAAKRGREALELVWNEGPQARYSTVAQRREYQRLLATARRRRAQHGQRESGVELGCQAHGRGIRAALPGALADGAAQLPGRRACRRLRPVAGHADANDRSRCRGARAWTRAVQK